MNKAILDDFLHSYQQVSKANSIKLMGVNGRILFDFSPSGDGIWLVEFVNGLLQPIQSENAENYDAKLTARLDHMIQIHRKHIKVPDGIALGWLKVEGDTTLISKLNQAGVS